MYFIWRNGMLQTTTRLVKVIAVTGIKAHQSARTRLNALHTPVFIRYHGNWLCMMAVR